MSYHKKYLNLFSSCMPVLGHSRSVICDLQRGIIQPIPNELYKLLTELHKLTIGEMLLYHGKNNENIVQEYIDFLIDREFVFLSDSSELSNFPSLNTNFLFPYKITTCIYEIQEYNKKKIKSVIDKIKMCHTIELRIFFTSNIKVIDELIGLFDNYDIMEIIIVVNNNNFNIDDLQNLFKLHGKLSKCIIGNYTKNDLITNFHAADTVIQLTTTDVLLRTSCGNFSTSGFENNILFFSEAQQHNTCLNGKIAIDKEGNVKNCPSMKDSFGKIEEIDLTELISETSPFTDLWKINKDSIQVCKHCEFRYVCLDCRAYLENPDDIYSKPLKCGYDPYTNVWENWSKNPLKQLASSFYQM